MAANGRHGNGLRLSSNAHWSARPDDVISVQSARTSAVGVRPARPGRRIEMLRSLSGFLSTRETQCRLVVDVVDGVTV